MKLRYTLLPADLWPKIVSSKVQQRTADITCLRAWSSEQQDVHPELPCALYCGTNQTASCMHLASTIPTF